MKPLILLLATAAALPHASPDTNVRRGPPSAATAASEASAAAAATALVVFGSDTVRQITAGQATARRSGGGSMNPVKILLSCIFASLLDSFCYSFNCGIHDETSSSDYDAQIIRTGVCSCCNKPARG